MRDLHEADIERVVRLCEQTRGLPDSAPLDLVDLISSLRSGQPAVVAAVKNDVVGVAVADVQRDRARLTALTIHPGWRGLGIGSKLMQGIEARLLHLGVRRIEALLAPGLVGEEALLNRGFVPTRGLIYYAKDEPLMPSEVSVLDAWGGELVDAGAWAAVAGMSELKALIEDRVLLPVLEPEIAAAYGLRPPATVMLFGPPGTGKTSFARAIAGRLGWPFVELLPSKLATGTGGLASELRRALHELGQLEHVVAFVDEFDELASSRQDRPEMQGVVNELLKAVPQFRDQPGRLLICATNHVASLDPAVVRPGRFDLMVPVGPPDGAARGAMWVAAVESMTVEPLDLDKLVDATDGFTPADLMLAAQRAAFEGFTNAAKHGIHRPLATTDFLAAVGQTTRSLDPETIAEFERCASTFART